MLYSIRRTMQMIFVDIGRDTPTILENIHFFVRRNLENHPANRCFCKNRFFQDDTAWSQATHISNLRWLEWHAALKISITSTSHPTIPKQLPGPPGACTAQPLHLSIPCLALGFEGNLGKHPGFRYLLRGGWERPAPQENLDWSSKCKRTWMQSIPSCGNWRERVEEFTFPTYQCEIIKNKEQMNESPDSW